MQLSLPFNRRALAFGTVAVLLAGGAVFALHAADEYQNFLTTENASIQGQLVKVSSPNTGRVFKVIADVGSIVQKDDAVAVIDIPVAATLPAGGGSRSTFLDARDRLAEVTTPVNGVVISRSASTGDSVSPNQTLLTVADTSNLWVVANIEETRVARVKPGQTVEVFVDAIGKTIVGMVDSIIPATTATFSLLPPLNAAGNFTKVVQLVPVRIALPHQDGLIVGASTKVRIHLAS